MSSFQWYFWTREIVASKQQFYPWAITRGNLGSLIMILVSLLKMVLGNWLYIMAILGKKANLQLRILGAGIVILSVWLYWKECGDVKIIMEEGHWNYWTMTLGDNSFEHSPRQQCLKAGNNLAHVNSTLQLVLEIRN